MILARRSVLLGMAAAPLATATAVAPNEKLPGAWPAPSSSIPLWPGRALGRPDPRLVNLVTERSTDPAVADRFMTLVGAPRLDVFRPWQSNGAAVLIIPGGGYRVVVVDREGYEIAARFAAMGFTAFVLFYRLPIDGWKDRSNVATADAQRAMRIIRSRAGQFGYEPARVAAMGLSAGGHVCADLAVRHTQKLYDPVDRIDEQSCRPMVAAPLYPVISMDPAIAHMPSRERLLGTEIDAETQKLHSPEKQVTRDAPPFFLVHADDDDVVPAANSLVLRDACKAAGVPVETHIFEHGGHGFAIRRVIGKPAELWPELFMAWARTHGLAGG